MQIVAETSNMNNVLAQFYYAAYKEERTEATTVKLSFNLNT